MQIPHFGKCWSKNNDMIIFKNITGTLMRMNKSIPFILFLACSAVACNENSSFMQKSPAKTEIEKYLYDAKSARWGTIRSARFLEEETGKYVDGSCGYINSKNRYGAYTGDMSFIYAVKSDGTIVRMFYDGMDDITFQIVWYRSCKGMELKGG